jgi:hypothetical protein
MENIQRMIRHRRRRAAFCSANPNDMIAEFYRPNRVAKSRPTLRRMAGAGRRNVAVVESAR